MYVADAVFRGVAVSAGVHMIEYRYEPTSLRAGFAISGFTTLPITSILSSHLFTVLRRNHRLTSVLTRRF